MLSTLGAFNIALAVCGSPSLFLLGTRKELTYEYKIWNLWKNGIFSRIWIKIWEFYSQLQNRKEMHFNFRQKCIYCRNNKNVTKQSVDSQLKMQIKHISCSFAV